MLKFSPSIDPVLLSYDSVQITLGKAELLTAYIRLGLVRLGQIKLIHLRFRKVKKNVVQMGCSADGMSYN